MDEVLILGNGISRISYHDFISDWPGEVWGCNYVFRDYGHKLTRLTGHDFVLIEAKEYREKHGMAFEIWGGHLGRCEAVEKKFTCHQRFCRDSGTTLVSQALHEGKNVIACGFDLGGPDVYSKELETVNKSNWITRWRKLIALHGDNRIRFVGQDHMPFLTSDKQPEEYGKVYTHGYPHIENEEYLKVWKDRKEGRLESYI